MFHNLRYQLSILDITSKLFGHRGLREIAIFLLGWQVDVDTCTLAREDFGVQAVFAEVNASTIYLVEQYGRHFLEDLHGKGRTLDDVNGGDQ